MKKLLIAIGLVLVGQAALAQSKIGTIDADYVLNQMPEMAQVNQELETYGKELQTELEGTVTRFEGLMETYQAEKDTYSEEDRKTRESELISLENEIKGFRQKAGVMMQMKRNELTNPLYEKINEAMLLVINEEGFTQILHAGSNALAFSVEGSDITEKVLQKLNIEVVQ